MLSQFFKIVKLESCGLSLLSFYICGGQLALLFLSQGTAKFVFAIAKSLQSCPTRCDPIDGSPPGSPVPGTLPARILEWVCYFFLQCMQVKSEREVTQSCPTLSDPMDYSLPGSSAHGIFQARVLEWVAIAFSDPLLLATTNMFSVSMFVLFFLNFIYR